MAHNHHETNEGVVIAWGFLIMLVCFAGAMVTGTSFVEFMFVMIFVALDIMVFVAIATGIFCLFVYAFRRDPDDKRTFMQVFRQEYNSQKLLDHYFLLFRYLGEYFGETETYTYMMKYFGLIERNLMRFLRHPIKTIAGTLPDEDIEEMERAAVKVDKGTSGTPPVTKNKNAVGAESADAATRQDIRSLPEGSTSSMPE